MNSPIKHSYLFVETALFLQKYATIFCQKGHYQQSCYISMQKNAELILKETI